MCGITGIIGQNIQPDEEVIMRMTTAIHHRGPDNCAVTSLSGCHLGHTRLKVLDLKTGDQPMSYMSGRYWITYNGEIYNYRELREELSKKGHDFKTGSDTEVLLASYAEWGKDCLHRIRGMFAFAIWDTREHLLFAARDLFGEKPFYYALAPEGSLLIASEIKALIGSGLLSPALDINTVDAYLTLGYVPPNRCIYKNIMTLPPGHSMQWTNNDGIMVTQYWSPRFNTRQISLDEAGEHLQEIIKKAVSRQMAADVPVGAFLSGGLDSSTIVAMMQKESNQPVKTFSVGFGSMINELPYASAVAGLYRTEHHEIDLGTPPVDKMLERMSEVYDEPFADTSHIPTYLISEYARKEVKVVLTGDGGDELFGGYWWYPPLGMSEKVSGSFIKWAVLRLVSRSIREKNRTLHLRSVAEGMATRWPDMLTRTWNTKIPFKLHDRRKLWGAGFSEVRAYEPDKYFLPPGDISGLNSAFHFDQKMYLPGNILVKVDRAAMAHGLETRAPFLDRDLVEFALSLPASLKVSGLETKKVLHHACSRYWPTELHSRNKQGFGAPAGTWLGFPEVSALTRRIFADGSALRRLLPGISHRQQSARNYQTWVLLTLGLWLEQNNISV